MTVALLQRDTVDRSMYSSKHVALKYRKPLLPTRKTQLLQQLKSPIATSSSPVIIHKRPSILSHLKRTYTKRRSLPTTAAIQLEAKKEVNVKRQRSSIQEVTSMSLKGAKRSYITIDPGCYDSDSDYDRYDDSSSSDQDSTSTDTRMKYVQFATHCAVVEIPHHREYSPEQKKAMWNGRKQIRSMARKGTIEYQYDGWNMENACEEEQFVMVDGEPVHPAHLHKK